MIKVYINNEEVLCDKNIVIKKEMLNTSSTILNNVYPKSWETTHDYTTNYYYPLDYSNCKITDIRETPAEEGQTIGGTNFNINVDLSKEYSFDDFKGNTTQEGTPTPTAPQPINVVSGRQDIVVAGKNLIPFSDIISTSGTTSNGITFTLQADGTIKANGTATAGVSIYLTTNYIEQKAGTYTFGDGIASGQSATTFFLYADVRHLDGTFWDAKNFSTAETTTRTRTIEEAFKFKPRIVIRQGQVLNDLIFKPQLEKGNQATTYEPYQIQTYEINLGDIELCKIGDYQDRIYKDSGKWYLEKKIGKIESYNGETITTNYISTTGQLTTGATVYYVLATPTTTEITDTELINQLESIELLEGINNISSNGNLPIIMNLHYNYVTHRIDTTLLFSGIVKNTGNISLNPREPHYTSIEVLGYETFLSEGETLDFVIYEKTIEEAIDLVINTISDYGIIKGNINIKNPNDIIGAYSTKDKTAYDVFNYIADITQSRWTTRIIDENTIAIDFYDPDLMTNGIDLDFTQEFFANNNIIDMQYNYGTRDYRNKQVMNSNAVYSNIETNETIIADGYQTQFNTTDKIGEITKMTLNGTEVIVKTKDEYELGYTCDFYYTPGNNYFESVDLVNTGAVLVIDYYAIIQGREILLNNTEINRVSSMTGRKGVISRYEDRNDATTTTELSQIGQSYLRYKGSPEIILTIESLNDIWDIGEKVEFNNAPLNELATEYMVKKKTIHYIPTVDNIFYDFELTSNFNSENAINYFDNQRSKNKGNIGQGETISRNIDISNTANVIFYDVDIQEVSIDGDNTLNSTLNSPLVQ